MKQFDSNAESLIVRFTDKKGEEIEWEIDELPCADFEAETIEDSENSEEYIHEDEVYRANIYVNQVEGNIEIFDTVSDEEITDFEVEEIFAID